MKDSFDVHKWNKQRYLGEIAIDEHDYNRYTGEAQSLEKEIQNLSGGGNASVHMGYYTDGRNENDPKSGKGYGKITFRQSEELLDEEWDKVLEFLKSKNLEITSESNYYDSEYGERNYYPSINFEFNTADIK